VDKFSCAKWCDACKPIVRREQFAKHDKKRRPTPVLHIDCAACGTPFEHSRPGQRPQYCPDCRVKRSYRERPGRVQGKARGYHLKSKYGLSEADWDDLFARQGKRCAVCGTADSEAQWRTDHDHVSGRVRGILCHHCNVALGHFRDIPARLRAAALYLEGAQAELCPGAAMPAPVQKTATPDRSAQPENNQASTLF